MTSTRWVGLAFATLVTTGCGGPIRELNKCGGTALCPGPADTGAEQDSDSDTESLPPVSMCEVDNSVQSLPDALFTFDGSASFSPDGRDIVAYEWSIIDNPEGSFPELSALTGSTTVLEADAVGTFDVQLNVVNELALRSDEPCVIQVEVVE